MKSFFFSLLCLSSLLFGHQPSFDVFPIDSAVDERIDIRVKGLVPNEEVSILSEIRGEGGELWKGWATFCADESGQISLSEQAPIKGTYQGIDSMGLIWSMQGALGTMYRQSTDAAEIIFSLESNEGIIDRQIMHRWMKSPDVQSLEVRDRGLVGTLFFSEGNASDSVVIILGGSGGGLSESRAKLLASKGIPALALAYFGCEGLPKRLDRIPLEYFSEAFEWLQNDAPISFRKIGLWGVSRGAELSLLLASQFPEKIAALVAYVPSSVVYSSIDGPDIPAWTRNQKAILPSAPFDERGLNPTNGRAPEDAVALTPYFLEGMKNKVDFQAAMIPVERIACPLLLVSGEDDQMWPSSVFSRLIIERLEEKGSSIARTHLSYPGAGHRIVTPYCPTTGSLDFHPLAKIWFDFGGNPQADAAASADAWEKTLVFFQEELQGPVHRS